MMSRRRTAAGPPLLPTDVSDYTSVLQSLLAGKKFFSCAFRLSPFYASAGEVPSNPVTVRVEKFEGGQFRAIQDFALFRKFHGY